MKLVVNNTQDPYRRERLIAKAVQAYWQAPKGGMSISHKDAAIDFLAPLPMGSPRGLAQKVQILEDMVETRRSAQQIAEFAASIADDALTVSRSYLDRAL